MVEILLRTGQENSAQQLVLESQFEALDADTLQAVLDGFENLETEALQRGLVHSNAHVRLRTLKLLLERGSLDLEIAERLSEDSDALVRNEAITALEKLGRSFSLEEVKKILVRHPKQPRIGLLAAALAGDFDREGEEIFSRYELETLKKFPEEELTEKVETSLKYDEAPYFARVERYFPKHAKELRRDIDDTFSAYFEERIRRMETAFGGVLGDSSAGKDMIKVDRPWVIGHSGEGIRPHAASAT